MKKAAIYARFSSDNQREESIDAQIRAIKEYAQRNNIQIVKIYTDEALSATTADRPKFLQMIKDSSLGLFNTVIVHKLDRFARNRYDSAIYKRKLQLNGVSIISVLENLDDSPESIILESVLEGMAEYYSANLARETMKGLKENAYKCKHNGGKPPLGYDVAKDKTYIINEHEAQAVKIIFSMYADGSGYAPIIKKLNKLGYKTKKGNNFGKNSLYDILKNEKYRGVYIFNRSAKKANGKRNNRASKPHTDIVRIEGGMPRIIDDNTWDEVQKRMEKNKRVAGSNKAKELYLLSGIIKCGQCSSSMVGNRRTAGRNKDVYVTYECSARKRSKSCSMKSINKQFVENKAIESLIENILSPERIKDLSQKIYNYSISQLDEIQSDIKVFEKELKKVQSQIDNIVNAIADGLFHESMKEKLDILENKKKELILTINEAKLQSKINSPSIDMIMNYLSKDLDVKNKPPQEQRKIIETYVTKVVVYEDYIDISFIVDLNGGGGGCRFESTIDISYYRHKKDQV